MEENAQNSLGRLICFTPAQACEAYYIFASVAIIGIKLLPSDVRSALLDYGARGQKLHGGSSSEEEKQTQERGLLPRILEYMEVPHSWFLHFYLLSVASSVFWAWQFLVRGSVMEWLVMEQINDNRMASTSMAQVYLGWGLMALQGTRRLYESLVVTKAGSSPMSSIHWLVGLVFYADMGLSVWIQGSGAILDSWNGKGDVAFTFPSLISLVLALGLYTVGYVTQNQCHKYLAGLRKYTLPNEGWFRYIICPHYTSECLIYLGLSVATAPPDTFLVNRTVFLGLVFVVVNLGTTAHGTNKWYGQKFGADKVAGRWSMIPPIF